MKDLKTADSFANSWNNLPSGSIYTKDQIIDWFLPLTNEDIKGSRILELGCGNASIIQHIIKDNPELIVGVDLGDSCISAKKNLQMSDYTNYEIIQSDMTTFRSENKFDIVYSIGVIHHLKEPKSGFNSVIENTKPGGRFHCWVYAREGNSVIIYLVDPIRKIASKLPWWFNKYLIATPLSFVYYIYAHLITFLKLNFFPLYEYSKWIKKRNFLFFRHVAFDQLVTPQTVYISKSQIENWLKNNEKINIESSYIIFRNGNSWKFGGKLKY
jgi:SAM-dependent methyltransferase